MTSTGERQIWVVAETGADGLLPVSLELTGAGRRLADRLGGTLSVILAVAPGGEGAADSLIRAGADRVYLSAAPLFALRLEEAWGRLIVRLCRRHEPETVLFGATPFGRAVAPLVAAKLGTGLTADCTALDIDEAGNLVQTRPAFGGNLMATILCPDRRPQMATVRPGVLPRPEPDPARRGRIVPVPAPGDVTDRVEVIRSVHSRQLDTIAQADILVVAGRGIGHVRVLERVRRLAELLGGEMGVSRPLVDSGWADRSRQVGQTGSTVAPRLLLSLGVSGAIQHLAGMSRAETIIAVNQDPEAPIFTVSTYGVVGDCVSVVEGLISALEKG